MIRFASAAALAAVVLVCAGGCESLAFQKWSPSAWTMRDNPSPGDVYWGANAEFVVLDNDQAGRSVRRVASVGRDPLDVWNTPVPFEASATAPTPVAPTQTANVGGN